MRNEELGMRNGKTGNQRAIFLLFLIPNFSFLILFSCTRTPVQNTIEIAEEEPAVVQTGAKPMAILQPGEHPIWFQLTERGPVHIESIEDAVYSAALIPWPLAPHVRFVQERVFSSNIAGNADWEIVMAVNRYGFVKLAPNADGAGETLALYRFNGGEYWRQYTVGGLVYYKEKPAAVLYLDDRFLESDAPAPNPGIWTFNMESNAPFPLAIPALGIFPARDGWAVDTLRLAADGFYYFRASNKQGTNPQVRTMRTADLALNAAEDISIEAFFNSAPQEAELTHPSLPALPEGFVYTSIIVIENIIFTSWEEQEEYSIGAAGFMVVKEK